MPLRSRPIPNEDQIARMIAGDWYRVSGMCGCAVCGKLYYDHPQFRSPYEYMTVLCTGDLVKL